MSKKQQQEILARNGENQRLRERRHQLEQEDQQLMEQIQELLRKQEAVLQELYDIENEDFRELYGKLDGLWAVSLIREADLSSIGMHLKQP